MSFSAYTNETLLAVHKNLEGGVQVSVAVFAAGGPKAGYAADNYHLTLAMLASVEDELWSRGIDPHKSPE